MRKHLGSEKAREIPATEAEIEALADTLADGDFKKAKGLVGEEKIGALAKELDTAKIEKELGKHLDSDTMEDLKALLAKKLAEELE